MHGRENTSQQQSLTQRGRGMKGERARGKGNEERVGGGVEVKGLSAGLGKGLKTANTR